MAILKEARYLVVAVENPDHGERRMVPLAVADSAPEAIQECKDYAEGLNPDVTVMAIPLLFSIEGENYGGPSV